MILYAPGGDAAVTVDGEAFVVPGGDALRFRSLGSTRLDHASGVLAVANARPR